MRRFSSSRGVAALEDEDSDVVAGSDAAVAIASDNASKDEVALGESQDEGGSIDADMTEGEATVEAFVEMAKGLGIAAKNGGIDKHSAAVIAIATEHMCNRVGMQRKPMPSMESFGGASTRIGATQLAMEGIKQSAKDLWKYIVDAFKKLVNWVKGHWLKVFGSAETMKRRAEAIVKAADEVGSKKMKAKSFEDASLVKALYKAGAVPSASSLKTGLAEVTTVATAVLDTNATKIIAKGDKLVSDLETPADLSKYSVNTIGMFGIATNDPIGETGKKLVAGNGYAWKVSDPLLGGIVWAETVPSDTVAAGKDALAYMSKEKASFQEDGTKTPSKETVATLTNIEVEDIAKLVIKIADILIDFRKTEPKLKSLLDRATKAAERMAKNADNDLGEPAAATAPVAEKTKHAEDSLEKEMGKAIRDAIGSLRTGQFSSFVNATAYPLKTGQASLNYCQKSLNQYE